MKLFFLFLTAVHGVIHLIGFLKAYKLAELSQLSLEISKPIGIVWLLAAFLFIAFATLNFYKNSLCWMVGLVATITSQTLILLSWEDAKVGTVANIIIVMTLIVEYAKWKFHRQTEQEVIRLQSQGKRIENTKVTEQMIHTLPIPVKGWLRNCGIVGIEMIHTVYLQQNGWMKLKPDQKKWLKAEAEQYITTDKPGFVWTVNMSMLPFVHVKGRDIFMEGTGRFLIKIASLIPVVNVGTDNEKINQSTLVRYLLELPWYPSAALHPYITWESIDNNSAKATMTYKGVTGSAVFHFNENGDFVKVSGLRYKDSDENAKLIECIGEVQENQVVNGVKIPTKLHISWVLEEGIYTWYKLEVCNVRFNADK